MNVIVTGAGGFVGSHLVRRLKADGHWVLGIDQKLPEFDQPRRTVADEFALVDLRNADAAVRAFQAGPIDRVYHLAADMGGIGFIETHKAQIVRNNSFINLNALDAARAVGVGRFLFTSSACVYPGYKQRETNITPLKEEDAYPADAEDGYGWEKLMMERLCRHYSEDFGLSTRIARFHNIFGINGTYDGGREKSPAAICRKVALAKDGGEIDVWGDGEQTRSYCYVDDCVEGLIRLMESAHTDPLNIGQDRMISINTLVDLVAAAAGKKIGKKHIDGPLGVRGRNSDNTRARAVLNGWTPQVTLEDGLARTYRWIEGELRAAGRIL